MCYFLRDFSITECETFFCDDITKGWYSKRTGIRWETSRLAQKQKEKTCNRCGLEKEGLEGYPGDKLSSASKCRKVLKLLSFYKFKNHLVLSRVDRVYRVEGTKSGKIAAHKGNVFVGCCAVIL